VRQGNNSKTMMPEAKIMFDNSICENHSNRNHESDSSYNPNLDDGSSDVNDMDMDMDDELNTTTTTTAGVYVLIRNQRMYHHHDMVATCSADVGEENVPHLNNYQEFITKQQQQQQQQQYYRPQRCFPTNRQRQFEISLSHAAGDEPRCSSDSKAEERIQPSVEHDFIDQSSHSRDSDHWNGLINASDIDVSVSISALDATTCVWEHDTWTLSSIDQQQQCPSFPSTSVDTRAAEYIQTPPQSPTRNQRVICVEGTGLGLGFGLLGPVITNTA
jgi:hypothetical protein